MIQKSNSNIAIVICGHGSKNQNYLKGFLNLKNYLSSFFKNYNFFHCFIEINKPSIDVCLEQLVDYKKILFIPFLIFSGRHFKEDIIKKIRKQRKKIVLLERLTLMEEVAMSYRNILRKNIKRNVKNFLVTCSSFSKSSSLRIDLKKYTNLISHDLQLEKSITFLTGEEYQTIKKIKNELDNNHYSIILHPVFLFRGQLYEQVSKIFLKNFQDNLVILEPITQQEEFINLIKKRLVSCLKTSN